MRGRVSIGLISFLPSFRGVVELRFFLSFSITLKHHSRHSPFVVSQNKRNKDARSRMAFINKSSQVVKSSANVHYFMTCSLSSNKVFFVLIDASFQDEQSQG
jgi:ureidoglycolate hydrolase